MSILHSGSRYKHGKEMINVEMKMMYKRTETRLFQSIKHTSCISSQSKFFVNCTLCSFLEIAIGILEFDIFTQKIL